MLVRDSSPCHFTFLFCFFLRLAMWQSLIWSRNLSVANRSNLYLCISRLVFYQIEKWIDCILSGKSLFSLVVRLVPSSDVPISESETILSGFLKDASFGPPLNLHTCNSLREFFRLKRKWVKFLSNVIWFLFLTYPGACTDVAQRRFLPQNHTLCLITRGIILNWTRRG